MSERFFATSAQGHAVDFLIARLNPPGLSRIQDGVVERGLTAAWIGDRRAFSHYQDAFHSTPPTTTGADPTGEISDAGRMLQAMQAVVDDPSVGSVGEAVVSVLPSERGFSYGEAAMMISERAQSIPSDTLTRLAFGGAAEGGSAYSILTPREPGIGAIAIHFHQGRFGLTLN